MIVPIVEGPGDKAAIPKALYRRFKLAGREDVYVADPIKLPRTRLHIAEELERRIDIALRTRRGCRAILIVMDADDDDPQTLESGLRERAERHASHIPYGIVVPTMEYEAWFLGSLESLRGHCDVFKTATSPPNPESIRDAKRELTVVMPDGQSYSPTQHQAELSRHFDMDAAERACPSFRRFVEEVGCLLTAIGE